MRDSSPAKIDRFNVTKELGRGSQGVVYLASDPHLERQVAIKTIHLISSDQGKDKARLLREARTVSKLQHPHIIPVYEAGEYQEMPYLVFEYVEGTSLQEMIRKEGAQPIPRAISLISQILDGIAYAHQQGVVHRDLKPANIMIGKNGMARIMDFGIAMMAGGEKTATKEIVGTPLYMSPEHFSKDPVGPRSDIFSLGLIFYEMLVGHPAIEAKDQMTAMRVIADEPIPPPSQSNPSLDKKLDDIVLRALARDPEKRYPDALVMKTKLDTFLTGDSDAGVDRAGNGDTHSTLEFLLRRMRNNSDFPTFSQHIIEINRMAAISSGNYASASQLSNTILKSYSLSTKLLKLVNSAFFGHLAGRVTTISRAVVILGFEQVRQAAVSLMLFEHLQGNPQKSELQDAAISSLMGGMIARDLAQNMTFKDVEEAFICSMFHNLGKHLVIYYLPEEYAEICKLVAGKGRKEEVASRSVIGISYEELGIGVARSWKFPSRIIDSMKRIPDGRVDRPNSEMEALRNLSNFSNELCDILSDPAENNRNNALESLASRFQNSIPLRKEHVPKMMDAALEKLQEHSDLLNVNLKKSRFIKGLTEWSNGENISDPGGPNHGQPAEAVHTLDPEEYQTFEMAITPSQEDEVEDQESVLINGIQEITEFLLGDYDLNDVLTIILETMYRGLGFSRVLLFVRGGDRSRMNARFGFGKDVEKLVNVTGFLVEKSKDVFSLALSAAKDIKIDNAHELSRKAALPDWYRRALFAPVFVLFPMVSGKKPVGLFYADMESSEKAISKKHLDYMKTLRNQAVLAIKQKR